MVQFDITERSRRGQVTYYVSITGVPRVINSIAIADRNSITMDLLESLIAQSATANAIQATSIRALGGTANLRAAVTPLRTAYDRHVAANAPGQTGATGTQSTTRPTATVPTPQVAPTPRVAPTPPVRSPAPREPTARPAPAPRQRTEQPAPEHSPPRVRAPPSPQPIIPRRVEPQIRDGEIPMFGANITAQWLHDQLARIPRATDTNRLSIVNSLHTRGGSISGFLNNPANSNTVIRDTFNQLYQIPLFRAYLNSASASAQTPELRDRFAALLSSLNENGLPNDANPEIIRSALVYTRYFAYFFAPTSTSLGGAALRSEFAVDQTPVDLYASGGLHRASRFYYLTERSQGHNVPSDWGTSYVYTTPNLNDVLDPREANGLMDADTLTVSALIMRRWYAVHPLTDERGRVARGVPPAVILDRVARWQAPAPPVATDATSTAQVTNPNPTPTRNQQVVAPNPTPTVSPTPVRINRIGIIGDSITEGNYGRELARIAGSSAVAVHSYGVSSQQSSQIRGRFQPDILAHRGERNSFNTVIIEAGINDVTQASFNAQTTFENIRAMVNLATRDSNGRPNSTRVIIVPVWGGNPISSTNAVALNQLLSTLASPNVTVLDLSTMFESPGRLQDDFTISDHVHLTPRGNRALAQLIYDQAINPNRNAQPSPEARWNTLVRDIFSDMQSGNVAHLIQDISTRHAAGTTLDAALTAANRTDLRDAFIRFYNEVLNDPNSPLGREFSSFLSASDYRNRHLTGLNVTLSAQTPQTTIDLCVQATRAFINAPSRNPQFATDLPLAFGSEYGGLNQTPRNQVAQSGPIDLPLLTALAVYQYRLAHLSEQQPAWARTLGYPQVQQALRRRVILGNELGM